ncbi:hypothetical protein [Muriicola jejuensis]|nr:hypothetical protein [Muriicola jejuensis]
MDQVAKDSTIEVVTRVMDFITVDTISSGWNTFRYINKSTEPHFILFDKYPEGKNIEDMKKEVLPPFDEGMSLIMKGDMDAAMQAFGKLPPWFSEIVFSGGTGLVSPGTVGTTIVNLPPGYYIMECYVKMADGRFHSSMGMTKELVVQDLAGESQPPIPAVQVSISSTDGISVKGEIKAGKQLFSVDYMDQIVHENFVGHDVNLVRLEEGADLVRLEAWMNWATPDGLMTPVPEGVTFLGGTNDAPGGSTLYFEAEIKPGKYAFISEVPNSEDKGMFKVFEVSE